MATAIVGPKGRVAIPKHVREAVGMKPGDKVEARLTATGGIYLEKSNVEKAKKSRVRRRGSNQP